MTHVICRLTAKNRDQLQNPMFGNRVWATFTFFAYVRYILVDYGLAYRYVFDDGRRTEYKKDPRRVNDVTIEFTSHNAHRGVRKRIFITNGQSLSMVWPTLGSRTADEQNRTWYMIQQLRWTDRGHVGSPAVHRWILDTDWDHRASANTARTDAVPTHTRSCRSHWVNQAAAAAAVMLVLPPGLNYHHSVLLSVQPPLYDPALNRKQ